MAWVKLDDRYPRNPKVMGLSLRAKWADIEAIYFAAEQDTDGLLPEAYLRAVPTKVRTELLSSGRWDLTEDGVMVHDYLEYNPSSNEREARSDAGSYAARMRWASSPQSEPHALGTRGRDGAVELEVGGGGPGGGGFAAFWSAYPRRVGRRAAEFAWRKACVRDGEAAILEGAERYRDDVNRVPEFTAHPTTWLNQDRWLDDPLPARGGSRAKSRSNLLSLADGLGES